MAHLCQAVSCCVRAPSAELGVTASGAGRSALQRAGEFATLR